MKKEKLISREEIETRIKELGSIISKDYEGKDIEMLVVLRGAALFAVNLSLEIKSNCRLNFIEVSSYEGTESTGKIKINKDITDSIEGKDVLIVEDIIDTGRTLSFLREYILEKKPNSLKICTLVDKPGKRIIEVPVDYHGFEIGNDFIIGYGFDIDNDYRNLDSIYKVIEE